MANYGWKQEPIKSLEVIIVTLLGAVATVDVLTPASKNDVKHVEARTVHFSRP